MTTRRARIRTVYADESTAERVAAAVIPDNTDRIRTRVEGADVVSVIERETTGGLESTVDDYVVNCAVAERLTNTTDDTQS